jgi:hypothetical protein
MPWRGMEEWKYSRSILNLGNRRRRMVSCTPLPLYPRGNTHRCPLNEELDGPQNRCGLYGEEKNFCPCRELNPGRPARSLVTIPTDPSRFPLLIFILFLLLISNSRSSHNTSISSWPAFCRRGRQTCSSELCLWEEDRTWRKKQFSAIITRPAIINNYYNSVNVY